MAAVKRAPKPKKPKTPKPKRPAKVKAKTGMTHLRRPERLDLSAKYLSNQKTSPQGPQVAAEATDLQTKRDALVAREKEYSDIHAELLAKGQDVTAADDDHDASIAAYATKAAIVAKNDPEVLKSLGVDAAATTRTAHEGPAAVVTGIFTLEGPTSGSSYARWARPPGAAAFLVRYRLEPAPGAPPAPYQPSENGYATKGVEWLIEGLPPAAAFRIQVCAIAAQVGPWSDEVLGKAR
jgi:hypothetical protein